MEKFVTHSGRPVVLDLASIDTDQIIPKQFLKRIERTGFGEFLFWDWRFDPNGEMIRDFPLNRPENSNATVLITGENFGCGSSREHAPWSLSDYGFKVIIAPSFADIFYNNCLNTGLLPVRIEAGLVAELAHYAASDPAPSVRVDLASQTLEAGNGFSASFEIDPFRKHRLLNGLDDIGLTLENEASIAEFEERTFKDFPFLAFS